MVAVMIRKLETDRGFGRTEAKAHRVGGYTLFSVNSRKSSRVKKSKSPDERLVFAVKCTTFTLFFGIVIVGVSLFAPGLLPVTTTGDRIVTNDGSPAVLSQTIEYRMEQAAGSENMVRLSGADIDPSDTGGEAVPLVDVEDDTVSVSPPEAVASDKEIILGQSLAALDFISDIVAASDVTASFVTEPNWRRAGTQDVHIVISDDFGNSHELTAMLTITRDTIPPVIRGASDFTVYVGESIIYRRGITAHDNIDGGIAIRVDSSAVNPDSPGVYPVTYSAADSSGNEASVTVHITVIEFSAAVVYALADNILAEITTSDMSLMQKARAIHRWVQNNISYTSNNDTSVLRAAYNGMRNRRGNCFNFYSVSEVLLTRAGVPNMRVSRVGGATAHNWNLINVGTGWYHFDATNVSSVRSRDTFMFTSVQAREWSNLNARGDFYQYDRTQYPSIVGDEVDVPVDVYVPLEMDEPAAPVETDEPAEPIEADGPEEPVVTDDPEDAGDTET
jgi:hypothetical protein